MEAWEESDEGCTQDFQGGEKPEKPKRISCIGCLGGEFCLWLLGIFSQTEESRGEAGMVGI